VVVSRAMSFGHANPVWRPGCEEVFAAFAPVGAHTRLSLAPDTCAPVKEVFQLPLIAAVGLLAVAIVAQAVTDETDVKRHGDEIELRHSLPLISFRMRHLSSMGTPTSC
jgi:hypothetical protein